MLCGEFATGNLAGPTGSILYQADLITLVALECAHYLACLYCNNFNFSSPFLIDSQEDLLTDPIDPMMPLHKSSVQTATTFMERLHSAETTPIIKKINTRC